MVREGASWRLQRGPFARRALPALGRREWTLLVQGVDLHDERAHALLHGFPSCRRPAPASLMVSFATDGGGVDPHFDSYDVFLQGPGPPALAHRPPAGPVVAGGRAAEDPDELPASRNTCSSPVTCCTCRRAMRTAASRWALQTYSIGFRAPAQAESSRASCASRRRRGGGGGEPRLYQDPGQQPRRRRAPFPRDWRTLRAALAALEDPALEPRAGRVPDRAQGQRLVRAGPRTAAATCVPWPSMSARRCCMIAGTCSSTAKPGAQPAPTPRASSRRTAAGWRRASWPARRSRPRAAAVLVQEPARYMRTENSMNEETSSAAPAHLPSRRFEGREDFRQLVHDAARDRRRRRGWRELILSDASFEDGRSASVPWPSRWAPGPAAAGACCCWPSATTG